VIVAVAGFWRVDELRRYARLRRSALVLSLTALVGVLVLGVRPGLVVAAALSLVLVIRLPLFYANVVNVREWFRATAAADGSSVVVIDLSTTADLDVETLDALADLAGALEKPGGELRLAMLLAPAAAALGCVGITRRGDVASPHPRRACASLATASGSAIDHRRRS
jgi:MFS superfamily sulfate permease-like transporter